MEISYLEMILYSTNRFTEFNRFVSTESDYNGIRMITGAQIKNILDQLKEEQKLQFISDIKNTKRLFKLREYFSTLNFIKKKFAQLKNEEILLIEEYKLAIMQAVADSLEIKEDTETKNTNFFKKLYAHAFTLFTPFINGANGFTGCKVLLELIPNIGNPISLGISIAIGVIEGILSIIDIENMSKFLGFSFLKSSKMIRLYERQLEVTKKIHATLQSSHCVHQLKEKACVSYKKTVDLFNQDIIEKNATLEEKYQESCLRKGAKWFFAGLEAILFASSGYFLGQMIFGLFVSAAILSSPLGWAIGIATALFTLGSFYYYRRHNIFKIIDHVFGDPKHLKESQDKFIKGDQGIKKFAYEMNLTIAAKHAQEAKIRGLSIKLSELKRKVKPSDTQTIMESKNDSQIVIRQDAYLTANKNGIFYHAESKISKSETSVKKEDKNPYRPQL